MRKLILIFCLFVATTAFDCGGDGGKQSGAGKDLTQTTAAGVTVISQGGITPEQLDTINTSVTELLADAKALGFTEHLDPRLYTIGIVAGCEPSSDGTPSFRIRADDYDGSIYDKNPAPGIGEVLAAERVLVERKQSDWTLYPGNSYQICPGNLELMANTSRYGLEHILLYWNRFGEYEATANHSGGTTHPLIQSRQK